jgi:enoyl-CoA hydratase/long-chain 3-hydroxyacyl-CoA dehydrogenase
MNRLLEDTRPVVPLSGVRLKDGQKNTNGMYPAPYAIMDCVKYGLEHPKGNDKFKHEKTRQTRRD